MSKESENGEKGEKKNRRWKCTRTCILTWGNKPSISGGEKYEQSKGKGDCERKKRREAWEKKINQLMKVQETE